MRSWVWLRPPQPPTKVDVRPRKISSAGVVGMSWVIRAKGASFCHVERIKPVVRSRPWSTSGSQKWAGASPSLSARAMVMAAAGRG